MYSWLTPIQHIRGIGPARAAELEGIGITTVGDLLEYQPLHYIYPGITDIINVKEGYVVIRARIVSITRLPTQIPTIEAKLRDETGGCIARWYNQQSVVQHLYQGMIITLWGKMSRGVLQQPKFTTSAPNWNEIAGGFYGVHNTTIRAALKEVLAHVELPPMVGGIDRAGVFMSYHFPSDKADQKAALQYLKQDEALCHQFAMAERRKRRRFKRNASKSRALFGEIQWIK